MITAYSEGKNRLRPAEDWKHCDWILMADPDRDECDAVEEYFHLDPADLEAALDEEEASRVEILENCLLVLIDIPVQTDPKDLSYKTIPLGILVLEDTVITVCIRNTDILDSLASGAFRDVNIHKRLRFVYQILYQTSQFYQQDLRDIDKVRQEIEKTIGKNTRDADLMTLHKLESTLVYFSTSLHANEGVLERLSRYTKIRRFQDDEDLISDVSVETKQAIEMASIYRDIIRGTRDLISTIMDARLNNVMKYLTSITLVMAIPTIISGFYGMNVDEKWMPLASVPYGFDIICLITLIICLIILWILRRKRML